MSSVLRGLRRFLNWHVLRLAFSSPSGRGRVPAMSLGSRWSLGMPILVGSSLRLASKLLAAKAFCSPLPGAGGSVSEVGPRQVWRRTTSEKSPWLALHVETRRAMVLGVEIWSGAEARGGKNFKFQRGLVSGGGTRPTTPSGTHATRPRNWKRPCIALLVLDLRRKNHWT
jgi:hypothetical protein